MGEKTTYHHGRTIKEYRELRGVTQAKLAELWPRAGGEEGVNTRYVQDVEYGVKQINDPSTLRRLSDILDIPLWKFGLSEYDPFHPAALPGRGQRMFDETLDAIEHLIRQIWSLRCAARIRDAENGVKHLNALFAYFHKQLPPPMRLERRFLLLDLQVHRLNGATALENKQYDKAIGIYTEMCESAIHLGNPGVTAVALKSLGKELSRKGEINQAVSLLEDARDTSLRASRLVMAFVHSYLSRVYADAGDALHFERAIKTGLTIAHSLKDTYEDGEDYVYSWNAISATLAEQSWGYLSLKEPQKTLDMRKEIEHQVQVGQDARVYAWIPLDWARAHLMLGNIEECVKEARTFLHRVTMMQSPHAINQAFKLIKELEEAGYGDVQAVKDFREELVEQRNISED